MTNHNRRAPKSPARLYCFLVFAAIGTTHLCAENADLQRAYSEMYNLDFAQAHRTIADFEAAHPEDPMGPVSDAAACLFSEFDQLHILQSEFFVNDSSITASKKLVADSTVKAKFDDDLIKTQRLAAAEINRSGQRANAMFADTLRLGLRADYLALIEKRDLAALSEMKKGRELAEQLLSQYPTFYDAYIAVGVENYLLSLKPAPIRWVLQATGAETDKKQGLDKLRLTAEHGGYLAPYARLLLAVAALRDGNRNQARELLSWLADHYPQNTLYQQELSKLQ
jgi:hypothetical protein